VKTTTPPARLLGATAALVALAACDDATGPADEPALLAEVAAVTADAVVEEVGVMTRPFGFGPDGLTAAAATAAAAPGGQHGIGGARSGTRQVSFLDADGNEQEGYDPLTTATVLAVMEVDGSVERPTWSASVARSRTLTVSGLEGEETTRTFDGTGTQEILRARGSEDGAERTFDLTGSSTTTGVVVPVPGSASRWPLSGTIRRSVTVTATGGPDGEVTRSVEVTVTFDGDETATATVDGETFEIDLATLPGREPIRRGFGRRAGG
jgi:hypothetical protein